MENENKDLVITGDFNCDYFQLTKTHILKNLQIY